MSRILTKDGWLITPDKAGTVVNPKALKELSKADKKKANNEQAYAVMVEENAQLKGMQKDHVETTEALADEIYRQKIALAFCVERLDFPEGSEEALLMAENVTPLLEGFDAPANNRAKV